jgi:hypothetical protein
MKYQISYLNEHGIRESFSGQSQSRYWTENGYRYGGGITATGYRQAFSMGIRRAFYEGRRMKRLGFYDVRIEPDKIESIVI